MDEREAGPLHDMKSDQRGQGLSESNTDGREELNVTKQRDRKPACVRRRYLSSNSVR